MAGPGKDELLRSALENPGDKVTSIVTFAGKGIPCSHATRPSVSLPGASARQAVNGARPYPAGLREGGRR